MKKKLNDSNRFLLNRNFRKSACKSQQPKPIEMIFCLGKLINTIKKKKRPTPYIDRSNGIVGSSDACRRTGFDKICEGCRVCLMSLYVLILQKIGGKQWAV
ncbi:hypothetical protein LEP1GSC060_0596 [Leptospira weilii serovar Ranarum str. ICFT]|uniref:Uncharacterized protein n=1 Tax=Leptospira weilii serovar Ranarum str. ICFT TaxID=1218598 RepID=N1WKT7_9LEPT|nr:hypothetical protein LEP1GSC060_0596 [Leptospira weilii serovar Ranarum str. ICFT]